MNRVVALSQICDELSDGLHKAPKFNPLGEYLFVNANNLEDGFIIDTNDGRRADESEYQKYKIELNENTILYSIDGSIGKIAKYRGEKCILGKGACYLKVGKQANCDYIYYLLQTKKFKEYIKMMSTGSTIHHISLKTMREFTFQLPELTEQRKIVELPKTIDAKIHNNAKVISEIETLLKMIYDYWFLQYDFPDESGKPYKSSGGKMIWNEEVKREIPVEWKVKTLGEVCAFKNGINYDKNEIGDKQYKIINVRNITSTSFLIDISELDNILLKEVQAENYLVGDSDILIARSGTPGAVRILVEKSKNIIFCGFIIAATPLEESHRLYLAYCIKQLEGSCLTRTGGSILQNVSQETLKQIRICVPNERVIDSYNRQVRPMIEVLNKNNKENQELVSLRDFLLPLLMNGQVVFKENRDGKT